MTFWRNIASLAARSVDDAGCTDCPPGLPGEDPAFSTAVTALGAKLAKADGRAGAENSPPSPRCSSPMPPPSAMCAGCTTWRGRPPAVSRATPGGSKRYRGCPRLLEDVLDGLFHIARSDGVLTADELAYLEQVAELFKLSPLTFRRLRAMHLGPTADDPYVVLEIAHDASDAAVRAAWREALAETHPDKVLARGLPAEFVEVANAKASAINAAHDEIIRQRRMLSASTAP